MPSRYRVSISGHNYMEYRVADDVVVKIQEGRIVPTYSSEYHEQAILEVVALKENGYLLFVPDRLSLKESFCINLYNYKKHGIVKRFVDSDVIHVEEDKIVRLYRRVPGMMCRHCQEFYYMSEPNEPEGTLLCWSCRENRFR